MKAGALWTLSLPSLPGEADVGLGFCSLALGLKFPPLSWDTWLGVTLWSIRSLQGSDLSARAAAVAKVSVSVLVAMQGWR